MKPALTITACLLFAAAPAFTKDKPETQIQKKLGQNIRELDFSETSLDAAIAFIRDVSGLEIVVQWRALNKAGVHKGTKVSLQLKNVPVSRALKLLLSAAAEPGTLTYAVRAGKVIISTPGALEKLPPEPKPSTRPATAPVLPGEPSEAGKKTLEKLAAELTVLNFDQVELQDAIQYLRKQLGAPLYVNWRGVKAAGASKSTKVSLKLEKVKLGDALRKLLAVAAGPGQLTYGVGEGLVLISTPDDLRRLLALAATKPAGTSDADRRLAKALDATIPKLALDRVELQDALALLHKMCGLNIYVSRRGLKAAGVKMSAPVTLHLRNIRGGAALALCLAEVADTDALGYATADGVVLISTPAAAGSLAELLAAPPQFAKTRDNLAVAEKLAKRVEALHFDDVELAKAIGFFRSSSGLNIFVDWRSLGPAGVSKTSKVTLLLRGVPLGTALRLILADAVGREPPAAGFVINDGLVYVSTPAVLKKLSPAATQPEPAPGRPAKAKS